MPVLDDALRILRELREIEFNRVEIATGEVSIVISKEKEPRGRMPEQRPQSPSRMRAAQPAIPSSPHVASSDEAAVTAPLMGTFYCAPKPGAPPFVQLGQHVEADSVVGLIEVMKLMNSVYAGCSGTIAEISAQDGQLVARGQILMRLGPQSAA